MLEFVCAKLLSQISTEVLKYIHRGMEQNRPYIFVIVIMKREMELDVLCVITLA